jgi:hypothetical protein
VPPQPQPANLTIEQMKVGITRLNRRIADLEAFDPNSVQQRWAPEVKALQTSIEESLSLCSGTIRLNITATVGPQYFIGPSMRRRTGWRSVRAAWTTRTMPKTSVHILRRGAELAGELLDARERLAVIAR